MADTTYTDDVTIVTAESLQAWNDDVYKNAGQVILSSVAGTNTITATATPAQTAYKAGQVFWFVPANTNTGATTINIGSLGAKNIFCGGAACVGGEIVQSIPALVQYDGTQFNLSTVNTRRGTFTPVLAGVSTAGTQTYSSQLGRYFRVGNLVFIRITIILSAFDGTTAGNMRITGLPFAGASDAPTVFPMTAVNLNLDVGGGYYGGFGEIPASQSYIDLYEEGDNVAAATLTAGDFGNTSRIYINTQYFV